MAVHRRPSASLTVGLSELAAHDEIGDDMLPASVGPKAMWLVRAIRSGRLEALGVVVPEGFVITGEAHELVRSATGDRPEQNSGIPESLRAPIVEASRELLGAGWRIAVRSSASVEDTSTASFAGEFLSVLEVSSVEDVLSAYARVLRSVDSEAVAKACRSAGIKSDDVRMPVLVQRMVALGDSTGGVLVTGHPVGSGTATLIEAAPGGAVGVVSGICDPQTILIDHEGVVRIMPPVGHSVQPPDESLLPASVTDKLHALAGLAETLVGQRAEVEWAWERSSGLLFLLQVRPLVDPRREVSPISVAPERGTLLTRGLAVGSGWVSGAVLTPSSVHEALEVCSVTDTDARFVLVVPTTSPEWLPIIRLASAVVTDTGGRTSHAAIVCRELGIPAVVGCGDAVAVLGAHGGEVIVTADAVGGEGLVHEVV